MSCWLGGKARLLKLPSISSCAARESATKDAPAAKNMYAFRFVAAENESGQVFIEESPKTLQQTVAENEPSSWSHVQLAQPAAFDAFLQRIIAPGGPSQPANAASAGQSWVARTTYVSLDGLVFTPLSSPLIEDWEIRVYTASQKGSASGSSSKGVVIEAVYLPVPYLPKGSTYCRDLIRRTLFPDQVLPEIEWLQPSTDELRQAGLLTDEQAQSGEWKWTEAHSAWAILQKLRTEGVI